MKLAIFGSRSLTSKTAIDACVSAIVRHSPECIVTAAEPHGICEIARECAMEMCIPLKVHFLDKGLKANGAWHHRSKAVLSDCDLVVLLHDGKSPGTRNEKLLAEKMGIPSEYTVITE